MGSDRRFLSPVRSGEMLKSPLPVWEVTARYCGRSLGLPAFSRHQPRIETATGAQGSVRTRNFGAKLPQISVYSGFALVLYHILAVKSTVFSIRCVLLFVVSLLLCFLSLPYISEIQWNGSSDELLGVGFLRASATSEFHSANYGSLSPISLVARAISNKRRPRYRAPPMIPGSSRGQPLPPP